MPVVFPQRLNLGFAQVFDVDQTITRTFHCRHDLVELQMNRERVLVLRALNEKHHQKSDDGSAGVDYKLPGIGIMKDWTSGQPDDYGRKGQHESERCTSCFGSAVRKPLQRD